MFNFQIIKRLFPSIAAGILANQAAIYSSQQDDALDVRAIVEELQLSELDEEDWLRLDEIEMIGENNYALMVRLIDYADYKIDSSGNKNTNSNQVKREFEELTERIRMAITYRSRILFYSDPNKYQVAKFLNGDTPNDYTDDILFINREALYNLSPIEMYNAIMHEFAHGPFGPHSPEFANERTKLSKNGYLTGKDVGFLTHKYNDFPSYVTIIASTPEVIEAGHLELEKDNCNYQQAFFFFENDTEDGIQKINTMFDIYTSLYDQTGLEQIGVTRDELMQAMKETSFHETLNHLTRQIFLETNRECLINRNEPRR
jgi:hypothetical protein